MPPLKTWLNWLRLLWTQSHSVSILVSVLADCISRDADPLALRTYVCPPFSFLSVLSEQKRQHWPEEERGEEGGGGRRRRWRRTQTHASLQLLLHHVHHQPVSIYVRVLKKPRPNTVIKHLLCPYWGRRRVIESEAWKCLNSFVVCAVFFMCQHTYASVCLHQVSQVLSLHPDSEVFRVQHPVRHRHEQHRPRCRGPRLAWLTAK